MKGNSWGILLCIMKYLFLGWFKFCLLFISILLCNFLVPVLSEEDGQCPPVAISIDRSEDGLYCGVRPRVASHNMARMINRLIIHGNKWVFGSLINLVNTCLKVYWLCFSFCFLRCVANVKFDIIILLIIR